MKTVQKLQLIQQLSGLAQEKLAEELGVSFVTINSWINGKSVPRPKAQEKIDKLFTKYTGQKVVPRTPLKAKQELIIEKMRKHKNLLKVIIDRPDIYDSFMLALTYNSNKIEGSTLTEAETASILFHDVALSNKSFIEQLEVKNHQTALQFLLQYLARPKGKIDEGLILKMHSALMNGVRDDAGFYRNHGVRIVGANVPTANYLKVPDLMKKLVRDINRSKKKTIEHVAKVHSRFEQIHPFSDGNGRVGRLIMTAMLLKQNLAPGIVSQKKKQVYYDCLRKSQLQSDHASLVDFVYDAVLEGFKLLE